MFLTAPFIHDGRRFLPEGSVIEVSDDGIVLGICDRQQDKDIITHKGILCPGFVNVHCHLELSHMKGMLPEHTGLIPFLQKVPRFRTEFTDEQIKAARHEAYRELINNGIVAVGDIANVADTLDLRQRDGLHVHTFVECIGFTETHARQRFDQALEVYEAFAAQKGTGTLLRQSIVPHAPYSVSRAVFDMIDKHQPHSIISIHNQESDSENDYYREKKGAVRDLLGGFGIEDSFFEPSGRTSLQTYAEWISGNHSCIFIHNTYSTKEDVATAVNRFRENSWCLCPNANLYLENRLPDVSMLLEAGVNICIGTDSLASNHQLCVLSELMTIKDNFTEIPWETLLKWGTANGAAALRMQDIVGSIEPGKQPGIINIIPEELPEMKDPEQLAAGGKPQIQRII